MICYHTYLKIKIARQGCSHTICKHYLQVRIKFSNRKTDYNVLIFLKKCLKNSNCASIGSLGTAKGLFWNSRLAVGGNVSVNVYLSLCVISVGRLYAQCVFLVSFKFKCSRSPNPKKAKKMSKNKEKINFKSVSKQCYC